MLLALLLPDPADANCPPEFRTDARAALRQLPNMGAARVGDDQRLRAALLRFLGDCADWRHANDPVYVAATHALIRAAHGKDTPLGADPFGGGGSIPLEALRLGCDAYAGVINPVACLILKTMLEDMPRCGPGLGASIREAGATTKAAAEREIGAFYPTDIGGAQPIAYLWARTVRCEASDCGAAAGVKAEWDDIVRDLDRVEQITVEQDRKHFVLRPQAPGCAGSVFRAVGVALPPLVRQLPSATPPPASPALALQRRRGRPRRGATSA